MLKKISTAAAPAAIGPYAQAIKVDRMLYTSGQIPLDPTSGTICGTNIAQQTEQVMKNLSAVLEAAGSSLEKIVKTTCFLTNMSDFSTFNEIYGRYITCSPARSCVAVKELPKGALVEVEAIALAE